jgi:serine/threonine-protein kinase
MTDMTGRTIGNYQVIEKLGEGGMGTVYRAVDTMVQREVALKSLKPEIAAQPTVLERFRSEAVILARLNHPAIAQLYTFFKDGDQLYMVMEYVPGETLEHVIRAGGAMPWPRALALVRQVLDGLGHAHELGILHRDLKPANIMLTPSGKPKLMDFGIAQALGGPRLTREGRLIGTLEYVAPERVQGKPADVRSDLYSVGVLLYEMLTGRLPFESDSDYELMQAQVQKQAPALGELGIAVPPAVEQALAKALEKDPERRYSDAAEFAAALGALLPSAPAAAGPVPSPLKETRLAGVAVAPKRPGALDSLLAWLPAKNRNVWAAVFAATALLVVITLGSTALSWFHARSAPPVQVLSFANSGGAMAPEPQPATQPAPVVPSEPIAVSPATEPPPAPAPATKTPARKVPASPAVQPEPAPAEPEPQPEPTPPPSVPSPAAAPASRRLATLREVHSLFVARSDEGLDQYIRDEIQKQIGPRLKLVDSAEAAEAVMSVTVSSASGGTVSRAERVLGFKNRSEVHAVVEQSGTANILWRQGAGDHKPIIGAFHGTSLKTLAARIVKEMAEDMR